MLLSFGTTKRLLSLVLVLKSVDVLELTLGANQDKIWLRSSFSKIISKRAEGICRDVCLKERCWKCIEVCLSFHLFCTDEQCGCPLSSPFYFSSDISSVLRADSFFQLLSPFSRHEQLFRVDHNSHEMMLPYCIRNKIFIKTF